MSSPTIERNARRGYTCVVCGKPWKVPKNGQTCPECWKFQKQLSAVRASWHNAVYRNHLEQAEREERMDYYELQVERGLPLFPHPFDEGRDF